MLYPIKSKNRDFSSIDGIWNFCLDNEYLVEEKYLTKMQNPLQMAVPSSYNNLLLDIDVSKHIGDIIYETEVYLTDMDKTIYFCAATHDAIVFLNGQKIGSHTGGFLPFEIELKNKVVNQLNRITVVISNKIGVDSIPCGYYKTHDLDGVKKDVIDPGFDFYNYSGLIRSVFIVSKPEVYIEDITITSSNDGDIKIDSIVVGDYTEKRYSIYYEGELICSHYTNTFNIGKPMLWDVLDPKLYDVVLEVILDEVVIDTYQLRYGFREIHVDNGRFYLNNKPVYFKGYGKHEDYLLGGRSGSLVEKLYDINLIKWSGANSVRTAHYPHSEEFMNLCLENGILVIDEVAAVGININFMPQDFKVHNNTENTYESFNTFNEHKKQLKELYDRDKNNASVVMWSIANEPRTEEEGAREYFKPLIDYMREIDFQKRPLTIATEVRSTVDTCQVADLIDVLCINRYYGWYIAGGELDVARFYFENELKKWVEKYQNKPIMLTEYGADTIFGMTEIMPKMFTEDYQVLYYKMNNSVLDQFDNVAGEQVWNFSDFAVSENIYRVNGNKKGLFTADRKPKKAAFYFKERWQNFNKYD